MEARYNVTGADRKALVKAIESIADKKAVYKKAPTFEFEVAGFTIDRNGTVSCDDADALERLVHNLIADGFIAEERPGTGAEEAEANTEPINSETDSDETGLTISLPSDGVDEKTIEKLRSLVNAKANLIKKALGASNLEIKAEEEKLLFPWFDTVPDAEMINACASFITALVDMARNAKRVTVTEKTVENEKYAFRCFLLRLRFIGCEYKTQRKLLLKNLSGSSAFKDGQRKGGEKK